MLLEFSLGIPATLNRQQHLEAGGPRGITYVAAQQGCAAAFASLRAACNCCSFS
jgi:hypothetical protein